MVGLERSTLPLVGERDFGVASETALLAFIASFGLAKALTNLGAGALVDRVGRRRLLVLGWGFALPVPLLLGVAPAWGWVIAANVLLGMNQGLAWSMTVLMKIDLVGPRQRGLALGLNEAAGYAGVALAAWLAGLLAAVASPRDVIVAGGAVVAAVGLSSTIALVRDTAGHVALEQDREEGIAGAGRLPLRSAFAAATIRDRWLRSCSQAGLANNLNDGLAWGLVPLYLASEGAGVAAIGLVAGLYPAVWGTGQLATGAWSDRVGRKPLIVAGMLTQALALVVLLGSGGAVELAVVAAVLLGLGTALVYPTLIAAISDRVTPVQRPAVVGVYRFWRDMGYVAGALIAGVTAGLLGFGGAIATVAALTAASGLWVAGDMPRSAGRRP